MKEKLTLAKDKVAGYWSSRQKKQKILLISAVSIAIVMIVIASIFASKPTLEPLYSNLTPSETGTIVENLNSRGITSEITAGGTGILVPKEMVDTLKVELAAEGIPSSGSIDYTFFSQNASIGMTDNEFNVIKLEAMQSELANLIKGIEGINDARVMITLPETGVFVADTVEQASASIVLDTAAGYKFENQQIQSLYHLVSKSVPNLPVENIVIMNQLFEYFDYKDEKNSNGTVIANQLDVKREIERDIQRQVQNILGTIIGRDKVVVSVTSDIDFSQEKSEHNLIEPVDEDNMEGITISAQRLTETFSGENAAGGVPQAEDNGDTLDTYLEGSTGDGDYEKVEETINNEVNRIRKEIEESPYRVRDLGIQVMVESPTADDPSSLSQQSIDDITQLLGSIIRTSIDKNSLAGPLTEEELEERISVSVHEFNGKTESVPQETPYIPWWIYVIGAILLLALIIVLILYIRNRKKQQREEELHIFEETQMEEEIVVPDVSTEIENEATVKRKQLEKLAKERPDEFAKLLRTWLSKD